MPNDKKIPQLYSGERQHENFCRMEDFYHTATLKAASHIRPFPKGNDSVLPDTYRFEGETRKLSDLIQATDTSALLVLQDGKIRYEQYFLTGGPQVRWTSWSVAKSFISALVGIAIDEGIIRSEDDAISNYFEALKGSAYDGVSIKHVLQMSSGARWNEDYSDPTSDVNRLGLVMAGIQGLDEFVHAIQPEAPPGTVCRYNSADTQALGMLLRGATGRNLTDYMQEKLIEPLGMESPGYWLTDKNGIELVLAGLNLTARDFAKIGELFRNNGQVNDKRIVSEQWVRKSVEASEPHLVPGNVIVGGHKFGFGYGYQWWVPEGSEGEYSAIGVYNQFVYVHPGNRSVIVKLSANPNYGLSEKESDNKDEENMAMLQAISNNL